MNFLFPKICILWIRISVGVQSTVLLELWRCSFVCLVSFLTSSSTTRLYRGPSPDGRLAILRAVTHETERGDHDFCLSRSYYTDTGPASRERAATAGTSSSGVAYSTNWAIAPSLVRKIDHEQGNSHPKSALMSILCLSGHIWDGQFCVPDQDLTTLSTPLISCPWLPYQNLMLIKFCGGVAFWSHLASLTLTTFEGR